jgi:hypothetical protein
MHCTTYMNNYNDNYSGYIEPGLAMWTQDSGIQPFPGGGLSFIQPIGDERYIVYIAYTTYTIVSPYTL